VTASADRKNARAAVKTILNQKTRESNQFLISIDFLVAIGQGSFFSPSSFFHLTELDSICEDHQHLQRKSY